MAITVKFISKYNYTIFCRSSSCKGGENMKKIVVVARGKEIVFTGGDFKVSNKLEKVQTPVANSILVVKDKDKVIAVFKRWSYWREVPAETPTDLVGYFLGHFGRIPVYRDTLNKNPNLLKHRDFKMLVKT